MRSACSAGLALFLRSARGAVTESLSDYEALRGVGAGGATPLGGGPGKNGDLLATFEFEDLLSYSYEYGEASGGDASTAQGGFGADFNLGNMNFGREGQLANTGRRDGWYVDAASFQGYVDDGTLGVSVAPAGDVDGDGVDDVIIGAPGARHAYVVFGSAAFDEDRRRRLESNFGALEVLINELGASELVILRQDDDDVDSAFGSQVSTGGDINGDGYDDVLVGASGAKGVGRVYVFYGGPRAAIAGRGAWDLTNSKHFPLERGFYLEGDAEYVGVGMGLSGGFDLNDDGFDDFLIGTLSDEASDLMGKEEGLAVLVYGSNEFHRSVLPLRNVAGTGGSMNPRGVILDFSRKDLAKRALLGIEMAALDDVNGDGHDDVAVGAPRYGDGGAAFVLFGGTQHHGRVFLDALDGTDGFGVLGAAKGDLCGGDVKRAGDFNGDGYGDVIVGAPAHAHRRGAAYIVLGRPHFGPTARADITLRGDAFSDVAGYSVSGAGDVDGDGLDDVLVGAFTSAPQNREMAGTVYCVLGGARKQGIFELAELNGFDGFKMYGEHAGDCAGYDVAAAGDFNDDGVDDLIVSAILSNAGAVEGGAAYVVFGHTFDAKRPTTMPTGPSAMPTPAPSAPRHALGDGRLPFPASSALDTLEAKRAGAAFSGDATLQSLPGQEKGDFHVPSTRSSV